MKEGSDDSRRNSLFCKQSFERRKESPFVSFRFHVSKSDVADFHDFSSNRIEIERRNLFELRGILKFIELSLMKEIQ